MKTHDKLAAVVLVLTGMTLLSHGVSAVERGIVKNFVFLV